MAMSQFSYGKIDAYRKRGEMLPVDGGFDIAGNLTRDPEAVSVSQRALPIGYWKGSGLAMMLDLFAAMLSGGMGTHEVSTDPMRECGVSQFFLAIDPSSFSSSEERERIAEGILAAVHGSAPAEKGGRVRYPGEQTLQLREENLRLGVPVDDDVWADLA
jgi:3-dehydro-L-gulonate 2-dehydrogenase